VRVVAALALLLAGCGEKVRQADSAGAELEKAAVASGLVPDPARAVLAGSWARDTDRLCVVGASGGEQRVGVVIDYGEGQGCSASGTVRRSGDRLRLVFGDCRVEARFDGERISFPAEVPEACEALCTGRASLAALAVEQLSTSESEAATLRGRDGKLLCGPE
jgi:hypothetical protein